MNKLIVPPHELEYEFSRASGPGGQNVNKLNTKAQARWRFKESNALTSEQKLRLSVKLSNRINQAGELLVESSQSRSQKNNKALAANHLNELVVNALRVPKPRIATKPTKAARVKRVDFKIKRSRLKATRQMRRNDI